MKGRLLVAAVGVPLLLVLVLACPWYVTGIAIQVLCMIAAWEFLSNTGILQKNENWDMLLEALLMAAFVPAWCMLGFPMNIGLPVILLFGLLEFVGALRKFPEVKLEGVLSALFAGLAIPVCLGSIAYLRAMEQGRYLVLIPILIPFIADAGAYFAGYFLGKHKMAPVLSPKKTVEGAIGGLIAGAVSMVIYGGVILLLPGPRSYQFVSAALLGIVGSAISIVGDLAFSMVKRETGIKDYGTIFRAHGGVLDRFDSVVFAAPVAAVWMMLWPVVLG